MRARTCSGQKGSTAQRGSASFGPLSTSEDITHFYLLYFGITGDREARGGKGRWPETHRGVAREAEALARNTRERVELRIAILVMNDRERIAALRESGETGRPLVRGQVAGQRVRVVDAGRKILRVGGQADPDQPLGRADIVHADVKPRDRRRRRQGGPYRCRRREPQHGRVPPCHATC